MTRCDVQARECAIPTWKRLQDQACGMSEYIHACWQEGAQVGMRVRVFVPGWLTASVISKACIAVLRSAGCMAVALQMQNHGPLVT